MSATIRIRRGPAPLTTRRTTGEDQANRILDIYGSPQRTGLDATRTLLRRQQLALLWWCVQMHITRRGKRVLDLVLASIVLVLTAPILVATAIAIKLESPGAVIFKQTRVGKWGKCFTLYKFRSMCLDAERLKKKLLVQNQVAGPMFKMEHDPRVTRVGHIIRKLSIDELPQLVNVLKGDMSMVGPRPPLPSEVSEYQMEYLRRLNARPGITGLPQVSGRSNLDFEQWVQLDLEYIAKQSIQQDLWVVLKTIPAVILGKGAY